MDIINLISKAQSIKSETAIGSITPERVGEVMVETLKIINEYQVGNGSLAVQKVYVSVNAMMEDTDPISDLSGRILKVGQLASVLEGAEAGSIYRFLGMNGSKPSWEYLSRVADFQLIYQQVLDAVRSKADTDGSYPELKAGDLAGHGESIPAEFTFRATGGKSIKDGSATIKELQGNAVVWNNMVDTRGYEGSFIIRQGIKIVQGHKYLLQRTYGNNGLYLIPTIEGEENYEMSLRDGELAKICTSLYTDTTNARVFSEDYSGACVISDLTLMFEAGNEPTTLEEYYARKPIVADEYAFNEGEVIPFRGLAVKSVGDNAWDEQWENGTFNTTTGELLDGDYQKTQIRCKNPIKILPNDRYHFTSKSSGEMWIIFFDNEGNVIENPTHDGERSGNSISADAGYYPNFITPLNADTMRFYMTGSYGNTYKHDIMLTLVHSGWKVDTDAGYQPYWQDTLQIDSRIREAFPNGMHKWDKVYNKDGKGYIVKGTGAVKIKDLPIRRDAEGVFIASSLPFAPKTNSNGHSTSLIVARFTPNLSAYSYSLSPDNRACVINGELWMNGQKLSAYATAQDFVNDYGEDVFYYELAEPTIIEYDKPFKLNYKVADFGTEELISEQNSAPFKARTIYQFNAVDQIRENANDINMLETKIAELQSQIATLLAR